MTSLLLTVFTRTPPWVWLILAGLVALGLMQARDHTVTVSRLLAQPLVLGVLSLQSALGAFGLQAWTLIGWPLGVAAGVLLNRWLGLPRQVQVQADGRFRTGGSWAPMLLLMLVFWLRYAIVVALAMTPALGRQPAFMVLGCAAFGLASGLFGARAWRVLRLGRQPSTALQAAVAGA